MKAEDIVSAVQTALNFPDSEIEAVVLKRKNGTLFTFFNDNGLTHIPRVTLPGEKPGSGEYMFAMVEADIRGKELKLIAEAKRKAESKT
jgi:hypothetical protein